MAPKSRARSGICRVSLPLHTLRADIDYGFAEAHTTYGVIGIKTWIYKGEILGDQRRAGLWAVSPSRAAVTARAWRPWAPRRSRPRRATGVDPAIVDLADSSGGVSGGGYQRPPAGYQQAAVAAVGSSSSRRSGTGTAGASAAVDAERRRADHAAAGSPHPQPAGSRKAGQAARRRQRLRPRGRETNE